VSLSAILATLGFTQGGKIKEWDEEDEIGCMGDAMGEL